jgi:hypothetical protein
MGIGRRKFLKFTSLALTGVIIDPSQMLILNGDYYVNKKLGLGFRKPSDWEFEVLTGFPDLDRGQIFINLDEDTQKEYLENHIDTLVTVISKYPSSKLKFSPSITIYLNMEDYKQSSGNIEEIMDTYVSEMKTILRDYNCYERPKRIRLSNCRSIRFKSKFIFEHEKMKPTLIDDECIGVEHRDSLYSIHLYDSPYIGDTATNEFKLFLSSLHLI